MTERERVHEQANEVVCQAENKYLTHLFQMLTEAKESKCQCPQCQKRPKAFEEMINREVERQLIPDKKKETGR